MCSQQGNKGNRQTADPANQGSARWFTHLFRPVVSWTNEKQTEDPGLYLARGRQRMTEQQDFDTE